MPPTARGSVVEGDVYGDLGQFAAHALRPGRVLLTRAALAHPPEVLQQLPGAVPRRPSTPLPAVGRAVPQERPEDLAALN